MSLTGMATLYAGPASADSVFFWDLTEADGELVYYGDTLKIDGWCWSSKSAASKGRLLEILQGSKWVSVGKRTVARSANCDDDTPYLQTFVWKVDRVGKPTSDSNIGLLRMRLRGDSTVTATIQISRITRAAVDRVAGYGLAFQCAVLGGRWDSASNSCIRKP